jgi:DNA polymerase-3 subunit delta'
MSWDICGHEWAAQLLKGHIARGEVRHAYLFTGPGGVGRRTLALQFAQALNCQKPPAQGDFCGACRACRQIAAMQYSDLSVLQSEKEGGTLKIEGVREVMQALSLMPYEANYRVALMLRFQEASIGSQNALLKTLEEAPSRVVLLLTADSSESLLPTIVSRCEVLRLRPMALERLAQQMESRQVGREEARLLAHLAGGRMGYAMQLKESSERLDQRQLFIEELLHLLGASRRERFVFAEKNYQDRETLREAYGIWLSFWRDLMMRSVSRDLPLINLDMETQIDDLAAKVGFEQARARVADLERGIARLDASVNARLLTEVLLLDWPRLEMPEAAALEE